MSPELAKSVPVPVAMKCATIKGDTLPALITGTAPPVPIYNKRA